MLGLVRDREPMTPPDRGDDREQRGLRMDSLVSARARCRACAELSNPAEIAGGSLDSSELGPWTLWQGRLDADVLVVGQDWGDVASFTKNGGFEEPGNPTNRRLVELLALAGVTVAPPARLGRAGSAFFTNAILCMKRGGLQAAVRPAWFRECGARFLGPTIELVTPLAVVALGTHATSAVCDAFAVRRPARFADAVEAPAGIPLPDGSHLFPRYHCGVRSTNMNRSRELQDDDWRRLGTWLAARRGAVRG